MSEKGTTLQVDSLSTSFRTRQGWLKAVDGVSFSVAQGEILGLVGESGCGKSVTSQSILRLYDEKRDVHYEGRIRLDGEDLLALSPKEMHKVRGSRISMIFQDALSSLNPVFTVGDQLCEPLMIHQGLARRQAMEKAVELLKLVNIPAPERRVMQYPHELSGGMRQRVMIAIALACKPELLIADEPTTALDVTVQAQIMDLIRELNQKLGMSVMLITHDLGVVAETCDRVAVMYLGQIVEQADKAAIFDDPRHPYTWGLIHSIPRLDGDRAKPLYSIEGTVPLLNQVPQGCCRFAQRCPHVSERCRTAMPQLQEAAPGHWVRCWMCAREE
ncbi:ABC transporter ATP-binding protein [Faecalibacterium sp. An121]|uniref:ABC transporter ATP-binding protein n=1 Tax=Faecalibacterium sp. An121 TaxID=1965550 RepID=UPI000B36785A|nr:ABC transporter ATP-binding protein [Faecalibacterium sp. An121]OUQ39614.1 peptide ABC transporter ATP-binding protein [Faecalibacterium sp. An121]